MTEQKQDTKQQAFDFSRFYREKTFNVYRDGEVLFDVTITEISHQAKADLQAQLMKNVDMSELGTSKKRIKAETEKRVSAAMKQINATEFSDREKILAIKRWGLDTPVSYEAWMQLPHWITEQIEMEIEVLNPELDEEFQSED